MPSRHRAFGPRKPGGSPPTGLRRRGFCRLFRPGAVRSIIASGHRPFVLAPTAAEFAPLIKEFGSGTVKLLMAQSVNDDEHIYFGTPQNTAPERFTVYSWEPAQ